jgi:hypothetical protein
VGTLTRYYAGQWETRAARAAREQGLPFHTIRTHNPGDAITDPTQIEPAVVTWRSGLSRTLGGILPNPLDWPEGISPPYFTDQLTWEALGGLLLWAAYLEQPSLPRPAHYTKEWRNDPAFRASTASTFQSTYMPALTSEVSLPGNVTFTFQAQDLVGQVVWMSFTKKLEAVLSDLDARTWQANKSDISVWRHQGFSEGTDSLEHYAQFGFAVMSEQVRLAAENRLPMKLDY